MKYIIISLFIISLLLTACNYSDIESFGKEQYIKNCNELKMKYYTVKTINNIQTDITYYCIDKNNELHYYLLE
jgi:hypothetical protein